MKHLSTMQRLKIIAAVVGVPMVLALAACGGNGGGDGGGSGGGSTAPAVTATNPPDTAMGAALAQPITATFSQALNATTVNVGSFTLTGPSGAVNGAVALNGTTASFTPAAPLAFNTDYTARLTTAIQDTAGNPMAADYTWRFNTGKKIAVGNSHNCARFEDGRVKCWGANNAGQLGLGDINDRGDQANEMGNNLPVVDLGTGRTAVEIAAGSFYTCARLDNGQVKCWGSNSAGQLGLGDLSNRGDGLNEMGDNLPAVDLGNGRTALQLVAGNRHTCARLDNGQVKCWGNNGSGRLGLGDVNNRGDQADEMGDNLPPVDLGTGRTAVELAANAGLYTCARLDSGQVKCWGENGFGQLGLGDTDDRGDGPSEMGDNLPALDFGGPTFFRRLRAVQLAAGENFVCARLIDPIVFAPALVKCWGAGGAGQLGLGDQNNRGDLGGTNPQDPTYEMGNNLPVLDLGTGRAALDLASGGSHSCARLDNGQLKCWGFNGTGQLGLGDQTNRGDQANEMGDNLPAVNLGTNRTALEVAPGGNHTCAHLDDGSVKCWGNNPDGQLGLGDTNARGDGANEMGDNLPAVDVGA